MAEPCRVGGEIASLPFDRIVCIPLYVGAMQHEFVDRHCRSLPRTDRVLATLFDMRIPLTFSVADCALIGDIIARRVTEATDAATRAAARMGPSGGDAPLGPEPRAARSSQGG